MASDPEEPAINCSTLATSKIPKINQILMWATDAPQLGLRLLFWNNRKNNKGILTEELFWNNRVKNGCHTHFPPIFTSPITNAVCFQE